MRSAVGAETAPPCRQRPPACLPQEGPPGEAIADKKREKRAQFHLEKRRLKYSIDSYDKVGVWGVEVSGCFGCSGTDGCRPVPGRRPGVATPAVAVMGWWARRRCVRAYSAENQVDQSYYSPLQINKLPKNVTY